MQFHVQWVYITNLLIRNVKKTNKKRWMKLVSFMVHSHPFSRNSGNVFSTLHSLPLLLWACQSKQSRNVCSMDLVNENGNRLLSTACWVGVSELPAQVPKAHWLWLELVHSSLKACPSLCTLKGWEMYQRAWNPTMSLVASSKATNTMAKSSKPDMSDQHSFQFQHRT